MSVSEEEHTHGSHPFEMHTFVISAGDLDILKRLPPGYPRPVTFTWIDRTTDRSLRPMTVALLKRTIHQSGDFSESVRKLHQAAGLRLTFESEKERAAFASQFRAAKLHAQELGRPEEAQ